VEDGLITYMQGQEKFRQKYIHLATSDYPPHTNPACPFVAARDYYTKYGIGLKLVKKNTVKNM
jgi:hypothetical protein